ncbi:MAG TPA: sugar phosphate nucleotidyltransferase [Roseiflexaceae bacterium]|nr:sugar phosphate nucleotidyltransferase [Roseiflexaceae bacterium]
MHEQSFSAVVMAGGLGTRLRPLTDQMPKPMLPLGNRPLLELIVDQLRAAGACRVALATHYRANTIAAHFGDGGRFGIPISYLVEEQPLGTAGALALLEPCEGPLLVMNGDILTDLAVGHMLAHHHAHSAEMTVAVRQQEHQIPYGVLESEGPLVTAIREKPMLHYQISAGIYVLSPAAHRHIRAGQPCDMPDLIQELLRAGRRVVCFPVHGYWLDVGQPDNYRQAQEDLRAGHVCR